MFGPLLRGDKVILRPARENDAEHFVRWFADMEVTRFLARRMAITLQQELEFLKRIGESKDESGGSSKPRTKRSVQPASTASIGSTRTAPPGSSSARRPRGERGMRPRR